MPSKQCGQNVLQRKSADVSDFCRAVGWQEIRFGRPPQATCVVLVAAVTKVTIFYYFFLTFRRFSEFYPIIFARVVTVEEPSKSSLASADNKILICFFVHSWDT
jgi:hypothetical protein